MIHIQEFERGKDLYIIAFDESGDIKDAKLHIEDPDAYLPCIDFVKNDDYWRRVLEDWLFSYHVIEKEEEDFKHHKKSVGE